MCGLFGFSNYSGKKITNLAELTKALSEYAAERGTDATGIAYNKASRLIIAKDARAAHQIRFKHPDDTVALIGHTRHATKGNEKQNYNNHPFFGRAQGCHFALAHNGVLWNDDSLRTELNLPKTKIDTDSYIAVQLLEQKRKLNFESLRYMAETVDGSFSFSILDSKNNIYLVKGDSPLSILHFPSLKLHVYASTEDILYKALIDSPLFSAIKRHEYEEIPIEEGEILKIRPDGKIERSEFCFRHYRGRYNWWDYGTPYSYPLETQSDSAKDYLENLKKIAHFQGYAPGLIDDLLAEGFSLDEVELFLYDYATA